MGKLDEAQSAQFADKVARKYGLPKGDVIKAMVAGNTSITVRGQTFVLDDNQLAQAAQRVVAGGVEVPKLKSYIERIERLEEEKAGIGADIRDIMAEAKSNGFDTKTMRAVLKLRKLKAAERTEQEYLLELYKNALGMQLELEV